MNFVWDIKLRAERENITFEDLYFQPARQYSPYYEPAFDNINQRQVEKPRVEINPLMRFSPIFEYWLHPDIVNLVFREQRELILMMFDELMHVLTELDLVHGMTRREFYIRRIRQEMLNGEYGEQVQEGLQELQKPEQLAIAEEMLRVMEMGTSVDSFCHIMKQVFAGCIIYQGREHREQIYAYIGCERDEGLQKVWELIRNTFLPIDMEVRIFWKEHFGIMGVEPTMINDAIAIF